MYKYEYVNKKKWGPKMENIKELIHMVQDEVRDQFTFQYKFIGSASRNMITCDNNQNIGYDFDINLIINDPNEEYSPKEIKNILKNGFDKHSKQFDYDYAEDSKRVLTIKVKDRENSKIEHSCDFAVVHNLSDGRQQYIHYHKNNGDYTWEFQPNGFYKLPEKVKVIKQNGKWQEVRDRYLYKKNNNTDLNKKSRSLYAESVNEIYNHYFK